MTVINEQEIIEKDFIIKYGELEDNRCIICGAIIPESVQVCPNCEKDIKGE